MIPQVQSAFSVAAGENAITTVVAAGKVRDLHSVSYDNRDTVAHTVSPNLLRGVTRVNLGPQRVVAAGARATLSLVGKTVHIMAGDQLFVNEAPTAGTANPTVTTHQTEWDIDEIPGMELKSAVGTQTLNTFVNVLTTSAGVPRFVIKDYLVHNTSLGVMTNEARLQIPVAAFTNNIILLITSNVAAANVNRGSTQRYVVSRTGGGLEMTFDHRVLAVGDSFNFILSYIEHLNL